MVRNNSVLLTQAIENFGPRRGAWRIGIADLNGRSNEYATRSDFCRIYVNVISVSALGYRIIQSCPLASPGAQGSASQNGYYGDPPGRTHH
jgi:hypothetical protein